MSFLLIPKALKVWEKSEAIGPGTFKPVTSYPLTQPRHCTAILRNVSIQQLTQVNAFYYANASFHNPMQSCNKWQQWRLHRLLSCVRRSWLKEVPMLTVPVYELTQPPHCRVHTHKHINVHVKQNHAPSAYQVWSLSKVVFICVRD